MTTIGIIGSGAMGAALAARMTSHGARVIGVLAGRSEASRQRAVEAGIVDVGLDGLLEAEVILSVVPPDRAEPVAMEFATRHRGRGGPSIYVDCNAVAPDTAWRIAGLIETAGLRFADAGLIGAPPRPGTAGATIYLAGIYAAKAAIIGQYGVVVAVLDAPNGAASALKMSYAGITKGLIALGAAVALAASRAGVAEAFLAELRRSQPALAQGFSRSIPDMLPKAQRWVPEMTEIERFIGDGGEAAAYRAFAEFYRRLAAGVDEAGLLQHFYAQDSAAG